MLDGEDREDRDGDEPPPRPAQEPWPNTCPGCWCFDCELHEIGAHWFDHLENYATEWNPYAETIIYAIPIQRERWSSDLARTRPGELFYSVFVRRDPRFAKTRPGGWS
jgi:hypothetical protein